MAYHGGMDNQEVGELSVLVLALLYRMNLSCLIFIPGDVRVRTNISRKFNDRRIGGIFRSGWRLQQKLKSDPPNSGWCYKLRFVGVINQD